MVDKLDQKDSAYDSNCRAINELEEQEAFMVEKLNQSRMSIAMTENSNVPHRANPRSTPQRYGTGKKTPNQQRILKGVDNDLNDRIDFDGSVKMMNQKGRPVPQSATKNQSI